MIILEDIGLGDIMLRQVMGKRNGDPSRRGAYILILGALGGIRLQAGVHSYDLELQRLLPMLQLRRKGDGNGEIKRTCETINSSANERS